MNRKKLLTLGLAALLASPSLSLLGCGGCSTMHTEKKASEATASAPEASAVPPRPAEWQLSPQAREIYAALTFDKALRDDNMPLLLESLDALKQRTLTSEMYTEAAVFLLGKKSDAAAGVIAAGLKAYPDEALLNMLYAENMLNKGKSAEGMQHMQRYLARHPADAETRLELATLLLKNKKFQEADELLRGIPAKARTAPVELSLARASLGMGKDKDGENHLRKALTLEPDSIEALAELAYLQERRQEWAKAKEAYEKIHVLRGETPEILLRLIHMSLRMHDVKGALQIMEQGPDELDFRLAVAGLLTELHELDAAEKLLRQMEKQPEAPEDVRLYLAELIWQQRRDAAAALGWLDKISEQADCAPQAALLRVQILFDQENKEEALKQVRRAQKRFPKLQEFALAESRILASQKDFPAALKQAEKTAAHWPDSVDALFLLASLQDEQGKKDQALVSMEKILKKNPNHYPALNYVGYTLAEQNRELPRAQELLRRAVSLSPDSAYIWDSLAWAQFRAGNMQEAWKSISKAVSLDGDVEPTIWEHYGDIAAALGYRNEAKKGYGNALNAKGANTSTLQQKLSKL